jgi:hypothetical protein
MQARCFAGWVGQVKDEAHHRFLMLKLICRLRNLRSYKAFDAWARSSNLRKLAKNVAKRLQNRTIHVRFWAWQRHAHASRQLWLSTAIPEVAQQRIAELEAIAIRARDEAEVARQAMVAQGPLTLLAQREAELASTRAEVAQLRSIIAANRENAQLEIETGFKKGEQQAKRQVFMTEHQRRERHEAQLQDAEDKARKARLAEEDVKRRQRAEADYNRRKRDALERQHAEQLDMIEHRFEQVMLSYWTHRNCRGHMRQQFLRQIIRTWQCSVSSSRAISEGIPPSGSPSQRLQAVRPPRSSPRLPTPAEVAIAGDPAGSSQSQVLKTGRLLKLSKGEWKTRWVELLVIAAEASEELNAVWIVYRKNEQSARDLGRLKLSGCSMVAGTSSSPGSVGKYMMTLVDKATRERLVLAAEAEDGYAGWIAALESVGVGIADDK